MTLSIMPVFAFQELNSRNSVKKSNQKINFKAKYFTEDIFENGVKPLASKGCFMTKLFYNLTEKDSIEFRKIIERKKHYISEDFNLAAIYPDTNEVEELNRIIQKKTADSMCSPIDNEYSKAALNLASKVIDNLKIVSNKVMKTKAILPQSTFFLFFNKPALQF
jgi:hypothetical protein